MDEKSYGGVLNESIPRLRRAAGLTQEQLADRLGLTFQAVSKWENGLSCPDVGLLPVLADVFSVSIDALFGRTPPEAKNPPVSAPSYTDLPWPDDNTLHAAAFLGRRLLPDKSEDAKECRVVCEGPALNVDSRISVQCGDVEGNITAGSAVQCGDVEGDVTAGGRVECGDVGGGASAGGSVSCGDVGGGASAGSTVTCGDVEGDVKAHTVSCGDVGGDVRYEVWTEK